MQRHEFEKLRYLRMLLYGASGTDKTGFLATFDKDPRTRRILILNAAGNPVRIQHEVPTPIVLDIGTTSDLDLPWEFLAMGQPKGHSLRKAFGISEDVTFNTVAIDTLSETQLIGQREITGGGDKPSQGRAMARHHWMQDLSLMSGIVSKYANLPLHVIFVCQEHVDTEELPGGKSRSFSRPELVGRSASVCPAYTDLLARATRRSVVSADGKRMVIDTVLTFEPVGHFQALNRIAPELGVEMVNPTATKILDIVEMHAKKKGAEPQPTASKDG